MLQSALSSGYSFDLYNQINKTSGACLLRHDIDVSLKAAKDMAVVEAELGIKSTYFLMLRSPCYNLFSRQNSDYVKEILDLGHSIGLHYDQGYDEKRNLGFEHSSQEINREREILESEFSTELHAVSFHQPNRKILEREIDCGGLVNTYDQKALKHYKYYSDSNQTLQIPSKENDYKGLSEQFPQCIQLLIHPMWWVFEGSSPEDVWDATIDSNLRQMEVQLLETERAYGSKRLTILGK